MSSNIIGNVNFKNFIVHRPLTFTNNNMIKSTSILPNYNYASDDNLYDLDYFDDIVSLSTTDNSINEGLFN